MREVEIDALDVRVLRGYQAEGAAGATADVDEHLDVVEAAVFLEQLSGEYGGVVPHALVEHLVEPGVGTGILERRHPVGLVEGDAALQHRVLQVVPAIIYRRVKVKPTNLRLRVPARMLPSL